MVKWKTLPLGVMMTNCYLVWDETTKEALIVDPADEGVFISEEITQMQLLPKYIVATHGHFDHLLGALDLKLIFQIPFLAGKSDDFLLKKATKSAQYWLKKKMTQPELRSDLDLETIDHFMLGASRIEVFKTPGHTPGGVCFYLPQEKILFSGDTLFYHLRGRTDLSYSSTDDIFKSLDRLFTLPPETVVLPGHGQETTIGEEKKFRIN